MSVSSNNSVPYGPHLPDSVVNESIASSVSSQFVPQEDAEMIGGLPNGNPVFVGTGSSVASDKVSGSKAHDASDIFSNGSVSVPSVDVENTLRDPIASLMSSINALTTKTVLLSAELAQPKKVDDTLYEQYQEYNKRLAMMTATLNQLQSSKLVTVPTLRHFQ